MKQQSQKLQAGFTILELMIATVIVSVILLLVTSVMVGIQNLYNKGVSQESIQNNVRNIVNAVTQEIQDANGLAGSSVKTVNNVESGTVDGITYTEQATCIGSTEYLYVIGAQVGSETQQGLWQDTKPPGGCGLFAPNPTPDLISGTNMDSGVAYLASGARLTDFEVILPSTVPGSDTNYQVYASVAIGTDGTNGTAKLLNLNPAGPSGHYDYSARCITQIGDQFCATASLSTEVGQRTQ